jgi:hypothetical protein
MMLEGVIMFNYLIRLLRQPPFTTTTGMGRAVLLSASRYSVYAHEIIPVLLQSMLSWR